MGESLRGVAVGATGLVIGILAAASIPLVNWIIHKEVTKRVVIQNTTDSELFPIWANPSLLPNLYLQVYPWNVKNPDEVKNGSKAILEQRGPYTYREYRRKENIVFNDNGTVSYIERKWYKFDRNLSVGWDNETFTTINIPLVALSNLVRYDSSAYQWLISELIKHVLPSEKLFVTKTVHEVVFGYQDEMLEIAKRLKPSQFYTDMVGVLAGKNYSYDGEFTIFTGENDINQLGKIDKFNGSSYLKFWTTEYANMINGSADGSIFPPFISKDFVASMFSMDVCRSATATYHGEGSVSKYNVKVHRYRAPKEELEKPSLNPDNAGFCTPYGNCMGSGVLNISTCQKIEGFHVPVIISFPHFYMAEDQYLHGVIGMHPTSDLAIEVAIEPTSGLVMQAFKKIQMNLYLQNSTFFTQLEKVRTTVFPILWVNESIQIDDKHAAMVKHELLIPQITAQIVQYIVIGVGVILFITGTYLVAKSGTKKRSKLSETDGEDSDGQIQHPATTSLPNPDSAMNGSLSAGINAAGEEPDESAKVTPSGGGSTEGEGRSEVPEVDIIDPKAAGDNAVRKAAEDPADSDSQTGQDDSAPLLST